MKKSNGTVSYRCVEIWDTSKQKVPDFLKKKCRYGKKGITSRTNLKISGKQLHVLAIGYELFK